MHPEAKLTDQEKQILIDGLRATVTNDPPPPASAGSGTDSEPRNRRAGASPLHWERNGMLSAAAAWLLSGSGTRARSAHYRVIDVAGQLEDHGIRYGVGGCRMRHLRRVKLWSPST